MGDEACSFITVRWGSAFGFNLEVSYRTGDFGGVISAKQWNHASSIYMTYVRSKFPTFHQIFVKMYNPQFSNAHRQKNCDSFEIYFVHSVACEISEYYILKCIIASTFFNFIHIKWYINYYLKLMCDSLEWEIEWFLGKII